MGFDTGAQEINLDTTDTDAINAAVDVALNTAVPGTNTADSVNDILLDVLKARVTASVALASVLGALADSSGTGAVSDLKTAMTYIKQLVTAILLIPTTAMRGTENAALAATALSNVTWTDARAGYLDKLPVLTSDLSTGVTYYVNGDVGSSGVGTSWGTAFKTVAEAVTASEAARGATFIRNKIYIQGIATVYAGISALPNHCDVIGIGANPNGNGTGICMIGGVSTVDAIAGSARGLNFYNIQFQANNDGTWCGDFVNLFRSGFYNCNFMNISYQNDGGLRFTGASGGITIKDCHWSSGTSGCFHEIGIQVSGTHFNDCVIENCEIGGTTAGVVVDSTCVVSAETVFKNNIIGDLGRGCVKGFDDNTADCYIVLHNNTIIGTTAIERVSNTRTHGNTVPYPAGVVQTKSTTVDLHNDAGTFDLFTGTDQSVQLESLIFALPDIDVSDDAGLTSISVQTDDTTPGVIISSTNGAVANLDAEAQIAWTGSLLIKTGTKIQCTLAGGTATAEPTTCTVIAKYIPVTNGGYLA